MSLDLGTLTGYLDLDDAKYDDVLGKLPGKLEMSGAAMKLAAGAAAVGVGMALVGGISNAIELDDAKHKITAQLGLTEEESARIGGVAGKLYADAYGESVEEVNTAVQNVVSSIDGMRGASNTAIEDMTAKALNFGTAFEVDTARSTQVVGQMLKSGLVADANEGFDLLAAAMQKVPAGVREDILDAADEYGPFFSQLGISGEEAMAKLVSAADKGTYGIDKTGDAVKEFSIRATDMSSASKAAYDALGLSQEDMTRKLLAGGDEASSAFDQIVGGLRGIQDPAAQSQAALALFGTPLEDLGTGEIPTFLAGLQETTGALGEVDGTMAKVGDTLSGSASTGWKDLTRTWEQIIGTVGAGLLPILTAVLGWLNDNPAILTAVAVGVGILAAAFIALSVAMWAASLTPIGILIGVIVIGVALLIAAIVALVMNWGTVVQFLTDVWGGFVGWFTGVMDGFLAWWGSLWEGFGSWVSQVWSGFISWISGIWSGFVGWLMATGSGIASWWNGLWSGIGSFFQGIWDGIVAWAVSTVTNFIRGWMVIWSMLSGFFSGLWSGITGGITGAWNGVLSFFGGIPGSIMGFFAGIGSWLYSAGRDLISGLLNGVKSLAGSIGSFFLNLLPGWIVGPFKAALGIASPSKVFRGYGQNIIEGIQLGLGDEQSALDRQMAGLIGAQDYSAGGALMASVAGSQTAQQAPIEVSLAGARVRLIVGEQEFDGYVEGKIGDATEQQRTAVINGAGGVIFS